MEHTDSFLGSGWGFPVAFSSGTYRLHTNAATDNVNDNIRIVMATAWGERVFQPMFGSGVQAFFFNKIDETLKGAMIEAVKTALLHSEPRITVLSVDVVEKDMGSGTVNVSINYMYNKTNTRHNYVFPFHLNEGTNL